MPYGCSVPGRTKTEPRQCPIYRGVRIQEVGNVWFLAFPGPNELSVIERCSYYRGVCKERLDCNFLNLFYWLCICKEKINIGHFWDIKGLINWGACRGGYSWEFLVGVCYPVLQILTLFQTKKCNFPHPFSDQYPPPSGGLVDGGPKSGIFFCIWTNMISSQWWWQNSSLWCSLE